ncbi:MAG: hypothetical protein K6E37_05295 [Bacteroidales bacterium]|nr:hypothetical protein [Bacteroidales bacterium]
MKNFIMSELFAYYEGELQAFISDALASKNALLKRIISSVTEKLVEDLEYLGVTIDESYLHTLDNSAVRHAFKIHGSPKEALRGQIPIFNQDLMLIPSIVSRYDTISINKNRRGQDVIIYTKSMKDGVAFYVEELRLGRHELAACTMYKKKKDDSPTQID